MDVLNRAMNDLSNRLASNQISLGTFEQAKGLIKERANLYDRSRQYVQNV